MSALACEGASCVSVSGAHLGKPPMGKYRLQPSCPPSIIANILLGGVSSSREGGIFWFITSLHVASLDDGRVDDVDIWLNEADLIEDIFKMFQFSVTLDLDLFDFFFIQSLPDSSLKNKNPAPFISILFI